MTRKTSIIILIVAAVVAGLFISYLIFFPKTETINNQNTESTNIPEFGFPTNNIPNNNEGNTDPENNEGVVENSVVPKLRQISKAPVAGYVTIDKEIQTDSGTSTETFYKYIDRATGNLYETTSNSLDLSRITNTTIPKIYEATFYNDGNGVVLRYLDDVGNIETFVGNVIAPATTTDGAGENSPSSLTGTFLPANVDSITKFYSNNQFFYTKEGKGYVFDATSPQKQALVLDSSITEWLSDWSSDSIVLTTKPSAVAEGFVFSLNPTTGSLNKILDNKFGLLAINSPDSKKILLSRTENNVLSTGIFDPKDSSTLVLNIKTLADKCVWSRKDSTVIYCAAPSNLTKGQYPDAWYQGTVSFADFLYKINAVTGAVEKFIGVEPVFDMTNLSLSENEDYLTFINKKDLQLWSLDLSN